jgi:ring-1,2-phenylacetyl-CoA epoxidase subunit PaaE
MPQSRTSDWIVKSCSKEATDAMRIKLKAAEDTSHETLAQTPGSSVQFMLPTTPAERRRYSLISAIDSTEPEFIVKDVKGGKASQFFHHKLKAGDRLQIQNTQSNLWKSDWNDTRKNFICFAGGIGISPVFSVIQWGLTNSERLGHTFQLFFSAKTPRHALLTQELESLRSNENLSIKRLFSERSNDEGAALGHITTEKVLSWLNEFPNAHSSEYIISGPFGMMQNVHAALDHLHVPSAQRHTEYFTDRILDAKEPEKNNVPAKRQNRPKCTLEIEQDSGVQEFTMHGEGKSILRAALDAGLDVPHSCRGGVCMSCRAIVLEGEVLRDGVSGLSEEEKAEGKILCCRTQPKTSTLKLRFDR